MKQDVDQSVVNRLRANVNARKIEMLLRELSLKIRTATLTADDLRSRYAQMDNADIGALFRARQELLTWTVRRQVLIECWEMAGGTVWDSGDRIG